MCIWITYIDSWHQRLFLDDQYCLRRSIFWHSHINGPLNLVWVWPHMGFTWFYIVCDQLDVPSEYKIDHKFFLICHVAQEVPKANVYMQLFKLEPWCMTTEVVPQGQICGTDTGAGTKWVGDSLHTHSETHTAQICLLASSHEEDLQISFIEASNILRDGMLTKNSSGNSVILFWDKLRTSKSQKRASFFGTSMIWFPRKLKYLRWGNEHCPLTLDTHSGTTVNWLLLRLNLVRLTMSGNTGTSAICAG